MIRPRTTLLITVVILAVAAVYYALSRDVTGTAMLVALSLGMGLLGYTLIVGSPRD
jgi:hypothetical protein